MGEVSHKHRQLQLELVLPVPPSKMKDKPTHTTRWGIVIGAPQKDPVQSQRQWHWCVFVSFTMKLDPLDHCRTDHCSKLAYYCFLRVIASDLTSS